MSDSTPAGGSSEDSGVVDVTELSVARARRVDAAEVATKRKAKLFEPFSVLSSSPIIDGSDNVQLRSEANDG
jgi:hypothetical protein